MIKTAYTNARVITRSELIYPGTVITEGPVISKVCREDYSAAQKDFWAIQKLTERLFSKRLLGW